MDGKDVGAPTEDHSRCGHHPSLTAEELAADPLLCWSEAALRRGQGRPLDEHQLAELRAESAAHRARDAEVHAAWEAFVARHRLGQRLDVEVVTAGGAPGVRVPDAPLVHLRFSGDPEAASVLRAGQTISVVLARLDVEGRSAVVALPPPPPRPRASQVLRMGEELDGVVSLVTEWGVFVTLDTTLDRFSGLCLRADLDGVVAAPQDLAPGQRVRVHVLRVEATTDQVYLRLMTAR